MTVDLTAQIEDQRDQAVHWLTAVLVMSTQGVEAAEAGDVAKAQFYAEAVAAAIVGTDIRQAHALMAVMIEALSTAVIEERKEGK